jgi:hypothetical protein
MFAIEQLDQVTHRFRISDVEEPFCEAPHTPLTLRVALDAFHSQSP